MSYTNGDDPALDAEIDYYLGRSDPNYPVPAIRQWFEFGTQLGCYRVGTDLFDRYVVLFHMVQERYDG